MERALDASVSVLVLEQSQKICYGVEYRLFVLWVTLAVRRLHRRRLGLQPAWRASVLHILVPIHACERYSIQVAVAALPLHPQNRRHDHLLPACRGRHLLFLSRPLCSHWRLLSSCSSSSVIWTKFLFVLVSLLLHVASPPPSLATRMRSSAAPPKAAAHLPLCCTGSVVAGADMLKDVLFNRYLMEKIYFGKDR